MTYVKRSQVLISDEADAVAALADDLMQEDMTCVFFFCSSKYNLQRLSEEIAQAFPCPVIGCTTAGEIGDSYQDGGIVGLSFSAEVFQIKSYLVNGISSLDYSQINSIAYEINSTPPSDPFSNRVGYLLIDGLSMAEEQVIGALSSALSGLPIIGGSAGDDLAFDETFVYYDGEFLKDSAVFTLINTALDMEICKQQHFVPSNNEVVVTSAEPKIRKVHELDGEPAVDCYAQQLNVDPKELTPEVFSRYPVMIQVCDEWYVRSIQTANPDGSLTFYCAIENGLPLIISQGQDIVNNLASLVKDVNDKFSSVDLTLGCDCILRRLEIVNTNKAEAMAPLLQELKFLGFSTYGEQFGALHVNQTLTCVVFGNKS